MDAVKHGVAGPEGVVSRRARPPGQIIYDYLDHIYSPDGPASRGVSPYCAAAIALAGVAEPAACHFLSACADMKPRRQASRNRQKRPGLDVKIPSISADEDRVPGSPVVRIHN